MEEIDDGGPAFPRTTWNPEFGKPVENGMSLRDWFAGQVVIGICCNEKDMHFNKVGECIAKLAYKISDAMIEERNKKG